MKKQSEDRYDTDTVKGVAEIALAAFVGVKIYQYASANVVNAVHFRRNRKAKHLKAA